MRRVATVLALGAGRAEALVFAVNEGVTYRSGGDDIRGRYAAIAADLAKLLKQPVTVEPIADYPTLRRGPASREYDIAYVHPAHLSIVAMRDAGYRLMAVTKGYQGYAASFLVKADSPMKSIADLKGASLGAPDKHLLAASSLGAEQTQRVQDYFLGLDATEEGRRKLEAIRFEGFAPYNEADMLAIGKWLGL